MSESEPTDDKPYECVVCGDSIGTDAEFVARGTPVCGDWCKLFMTHGGTPRRLMEYEVTYDPSEDVLRVDDSEKPMIPSGEREYLRSHLADVADGERITGVAEFRAGVFWEFRKT